VSKAVAARGGFNLLEQFGFKPVNKYLPPRPRRDGISDFRPEPQDPAGAGTALESLFLWIDKTLSE
jgi:hypothetical protein